MTHVNIDGDVICYAVGFAAEDTMYFDDMQQAYGSKKEAIEAGADPDTLTKVTTAEPVHYTLSTAKRMIANIVEAVGADTYNVVLSGKGNFRETRATLQPYKGNRTEQPKPLLYNEIKEYIQQYQNCVTVDGEEADDFLGYSAVSAGDIIATVDKDLDNVPGKHYNWNKPDKGVYEVSEVEAWRNFFTQCLTGDSTDNIPGLYRLTGQRATAKIKAPLLDMTDPWDMYDYVFSVYLDALADDGYAFNMAHQEVDDMLREVADLLWIRWSPGNSWWTQLHNCRKEVEHEAGE